VVLDPRGLYEFAESIPTLGEPVLIQALDGFVDAGGARRLTREHLLSTLRSEQIVTFDIDQLYDYRARRPHMLLAANKWESFNAPTLAVHAVWDANDTPFLLLSGPEPDTQWERFVAAVELIMQVLGARLIVGLSAIPMNVPHTRPLGVIAHGTPAELIEDYPKVRESVRVPASVGHVLELRLGQAGIDAIGFATNVPHYLANLDYPQAAISLIECIEKSSGLRLPVEALAEAAIEIRESIDAQVTESEEIQQVVSSLEKSYDDSLATFGLGPISDGGPLPTADELGAEFERYLSSQPGQSDHPDAG